MSSSTYRRLAAAAFLGGLLLASPPVTSGGPIWDIGVGSGYFCVVLVIFLYVYPLRGDGLAHSRLLGLSQHRRLGWWVLSAGLIHVAVLLIVQPSTGRYLLPSAPVFMWCGIAALLVAGALIQTGLAARSAMRRSKSPRTHATLHVVLAVTIVPALCAHVMGSGQFATGVSKIAALCLLLALPPAWYALRPRTGRSNQNRLRRVSHVGAVALIPLLPTPLARQLLLEPAARPTSIGVNFPHDSHTSINCVACHHNFVDHTGVTGCVDCHRSQRADLPRSSEATFHSFCRDCHTQMALEGNRHGPTRACSGCHKAPG